jgi:phosphoserine aminotransferase
MNTHKRPGIRPANPNFSSGPCAKRPGWSLDVLKDALTSRSHRSDPGKLKLAETIDRTRDVLGIPEDYRVGIVPASDTGAVEMAMWSLLGQRGVDILAWESFGAGWQKDVTEQLDLENVRLLSADYGQLPDLSVVNFSQDVVFTWNGTTSGVCVPNGDWIASDRQGLTICDATSAVFAYDLPWDKLDVTTYSWQKVIGGEAAHGVLILSPRAIKRLETYSPPWPMPKVFRLTKEGKLIEGIFRGETINTPSMIVVEDALDGLKWAERTGGHKALIARCKANLAAIEGWVSKSSWANFLAQKTAHRSRTSVCLMVDDDWFKSLNTDKQSIVIKAIVKKLDQEGAAYDIGSHRDAPPGFRLWAGATIETSNLKQLFPWLDWAYAQIKAEMEN